jgi:membrane protease YdiL (CAAX protease family)
MNRIKRLATESPLAFGFGATFVFILLTIIAAIVASAFWPGDTPEWYIGSTVARLVEIFILLAPLSLLGWLNSAGFTRLGSRQTWLIVLLALAYAIPTTAYAMTGNVDFSFSDPMTAVAAAVFIMGHAFLEEAAFRGLILHAFARSWGKTSSGLIKSVLFSSLLFGGYHLIYIIGEPPAVVLLRVVTGFSLGIFFAALVLSGRSIYPAAFGHGIINLAAYLNLSANNAEGTPSGWLWVSLLIIPLALLGLTILRGVRQRPVVFDAAQAWQGEL